MTDTLTKTIILNAAPAKVWDYLTRSEKLATWFHPTREDLAAGDEYTCIRIGEDGQERPQIWGRVMEASPPSKLVCTFCIAPFGEAETVVTWNLVDIGGATRLTLTHEGIGAAAGDQALALLSGLDAGWDKHFATFRDEVGA